MSTGFWAAISAAVTALGSLIVSIVNLRRVEKVHVLVNSNMTALREWSQKLAEKLEDRDIPLPPDDPR